MIEVVLGELASVEAAGILRPVSAEWTAVTPAMRRFERALAPEVGEQCRRMGELPVGTAIVTAAPGLAAEWLIHVIVRSITEPVTEAGIAKGLVHGLRRAEEWGVGALALPPLGTGAGNLDAEAAADLMLGPLLEWVHSGREPRQATLVVDSEYEQEVFERKLRQATVAVETTDLPLLEP